MMYKYLETAIKFSTWANVLYITGNMRLALSVAVSWGIWNNTVDGFQEQEKIKTL